MSIFSGLSTPRYLSPEESWANTGQLAPLIAANFARGMERADKLQERNQEIQGAKDIASHLDGLTPEEQRATITAHPAWAMSPITAPAVSNFLNMQSQQLSLSRNLAMQDAATQSKVGETVLAGVLSDIARKGSWTDPESKSRAWEVATKYPGLMDTPAWKNTLDKFDKADKAQLERDKLQDQVDAANTRAEIADERVKLAQDKAAAGSPAKQVLDEADKEDDFAAKAKAAGNQAEYARHTQRAQTLRESVNTHAQETTQIGYDDQGRPIFSVTRGGKGSSSEGTVATQSAAQQNLIKYGNAMQLINSLQRNLRPQDIGVAGKGGEMVLDRGLAQLDPRLANKQRIKNRDALTILKESLMRTVTDDTRRFSNQDREDIAQALPSNGMFESFEDAKTKLNVVRGIIIDRARNYSERTGTPLPDYAKTADEIKSEYQRKKAAFQAAVKAGNLSQADADAQIKKAYDDAMSSLVNYH